MNSNQLISNDEALRLFFNDDIYLVHEIKPAAEVVADTSAAPKEQLPQSTAVPAPDTLAIHIPAEVAEPLPKYQAPLNFKHLGKNEKAILILVNDLQNPVSTPQGTELLRKLVLSINLKNADFALVNYAGYTEANFEQLKSFFKCKLLLSFGVSAVELGLAENSLHQLHISDGVKMIFTHNLHDLDADTTSKKALWGTLKNL